MRVLSGIYRICEEISCRISSCNAYTNSVCLHKVAFAVKSVGLYMYPTSTTKVNLCSLYGDEVIFSSYIVGYPIAQITWCLYAWGRHYLSFLAFDLWFNKQLDITNQRRFYCRLCSSSRDATNAQRIDRSTLESMLVINFYYRLSSIVISSSLIVFICHIFVLCTAASNSSLCSLHVAVIDYSCYFDHAERLVRIRTSRTLNKYSEWHQSFLSYAYETSTQIQIVSRILTAVVVF